MRVVSPNRSSCLPRHHIGLTLANITRLIYDCPEKSVFDFQRVYFWSCFGRRQLFRPLQNNRSYVSEAKGGKTTAPSTWPCSCERCSGGPGVEVASGRHLGEPAKLVSHWQMGAVVSGSRVHAAASCGSFPSQSPPPWAL